MTSIRDIAWFAGLYEGEGSVAIETAKLVPRLRIEMCDRDVIERAAALAGAKVYSSQRNQVKRPDRWSPSYRFVLSGARSIEWLMTIYPFLGERRRQQIREALSYWRGRKRQPGGWTAHHMRYGCQCQARSTGSCQKVHPLERWEPAP